MARRHTLGWGQPAPGWGQAFPGWDPLPDAGSLPLRVARSLARWWWPISAVGGFLVVVGYTLGHDGPGPGLSDRGWLTVALAAVVVANLSVRRTRGTGRAPLARALAEYVVVALLVGALVTLQPVTPAHSPGRHVDRSTLVEAPRTKAPARREGARPEPAQREQAPTLFDRVVDVAGWVGDLWHQATE